jgi:plastocyanin
VKFLAPFVALLFLVLSACGEDNKVGEGVDLGIKNQVEQERLGARTTTTAAAVTTAPPQQQKASVGATTAPPTTAPAATTTAPPTTQAPEKIAIEISINGDSSGTTQFEPSQTRVFSGSLVKWTNKDSVARSVEADDGTFKSGSLEPGQSFTYRADKVGRFNYTDGTRPYAVGALEVIAR